MDSPSTSAAALREEIARLTGAINQHKTLGYQAKQPPTSLQPGRPRSNVYVNPNYKPPSRPQAQATEAPKAVDRPPPSRPVPPPTSGPRDVVIGGVAFQSSGRSLVRKDLAVAKPKPPSYRPPLQSTSFARTKAASMVHTNRPYKPRNSRRGRPGNRNMTLNNSVRPPGGRRRKFVDKPCPRFTITGACGRGLTCPYTHDPSKIAICWPFLQGSCPHTAETCPLSHDPTPERTPLCVHFANAGRCTRGNCPFPHVRVGRREGVCRDFAVLGYCEKGLDCEHQHVRECPDFAEKGICTIKGCKLPHVIRANRSRPKETISSSPTKIETSTSGSGTDSVTAAFTDGSDVRVWADDAQLGDEYISLTFHESESEDESEEEDTDDEGEDEDEAREPSADAIVVHA